MSPTRKRPDVQPGLRKHACGHGDVPLAVESSYVLRVIGDDGLTHYGVIRVTHLGYDQNGDSIMIFDWAYQLQPGNRSLAPQPGT